MFSFPYATPHGNTAVGRVKNSEYFLGVDFIQALLMHHFVSKHFVFPLHFFAFKEDKQEKNRTQACGVVFILKWNFQTELIFVQTSI